MSETSPNAPTVRVALLGDSQVGKSSLLSLWFAEKLPEKYEATSDELTRKLLVDTLGDKHTEPGKVELTITDTGGCNASKDWPRLVENNEAIVLVFSVEKKETFVSIQTFADMLRTRAKPSVVLIIANAPTGAPREISSEEVTKLTAALGIDYHLVETSTFNGEGVEHGRHALAAMCVRGPITMLFPRAVNVPGVYCPTYKNICLMGDTQIGKSELLYWWCYRKKQPKYERTYEFEKMLHADANLYERQCQLKFLDTGGNSLADDKEYTRWVKKGEHFMLVFSVEDTATFDRLKYLYAKIKESKPDAKMLIVANAPTGKPRQVDEAEAFAMVRALDANVAFIETATHHSERFASRAPHALNALMGVLTDTVPLVVRAPAKLEQAKPEIEQPKPEIEQAKPVVEQPKPVVEQPVPPAAPVEKAKLEYCPEFKDIFLMGDEQTGKSDLLHWWSHERKQKQYSATWEFSKKVMVDANIAAGQCEIAFMDTGGGEMSSDEDYERWVQTGKHFVLVFSVEKRSSFDRVQALHAMIKESKPDAKVLIIANAPEGKPRELDEAEAAGLASELDAKATFLETATHHHDKQAARAEHALQALVGVLTAPVDMAAPAPVQPVAAAAAVVPSPEMDSATLYALLMAAQSKADAERVALQTQLDEKEAELAKERVLRMKLEAQLEAGAFNPVPGGAGAGYETPVKGGAPPVAEASPAPIAASPAKEEEEGAAEPSKVDASDPDERGEKKKRNLFGSRGSSKPGSKRGSKSESGGSRRGSAIKTIRKALWAPFRKSSKDKGGAGSSGPAAREAVVSK